MIKKLKLLTIGAALVLAVAGPANAREWAHFQLTVDSASHSIWGSVEASTLIKKKMTQVEGSYPPGMHLNISFLQNELNGASSFDDGSYDGWFVVKQARDGSALC